MDFECLMYGPDPIYYLKNANDMIKQVGKYSKKDLIDFGNFLRTHHPMGATVVSEKDIDEWNRIESRKFSVKKYLQKAMVSNDVCLSGFDEWFESFYEDNKPDF